MQSYYLTFNFTHEWNARSDYSSYAWVRSGIDKVHLFIFGSLLAAAVCRLQSDQLESVKLYFNQTLLLKFAETIFPKWLYIHYWSNAYYTWTIKPGVKKYYDIIIYIYHNIKINKQTNKLKNLNTKKKKPQTDLQMMDASLQYSWTLLQQYDNDE